jgi:hypothetical protein
VIPERLQATDQRRDSSAEEVPAPAPAVVPVTVAKIEAVQRTAGNSAATRMVQSLAAAGDAFAEATSGAPSTLPHRGRMEQAFGQSFAGVSAHVGTTAVRRGLARLGARAAAFGEGVAFAESSPTPHDVAHELAHVVQQRRGSRAVQAKAVGVSAPGDHAELAADRAADAVVRNEPVPPVGAADGSKLHRTTVNTNGGVFDNGPMYAPVNGTGTVGDRIGANIMLDFIPGDLVEAPTNGIALIQTVKGVTNRVPRTGTLNPTRDQGNTAVSADPDDTGLVAPNGFAIDVPIHQPGRPDPNHNPIYGVGFGAAAPSASLTDGTPTLGRTQRGAHVRDSVTGAFDPPVNAQMEDGPRRIIQVAGQTFEMNFEVAALVTDGPMQNTYLGSVEWGWQSDAAGIVTLKAFVPLASGAPTAAFMQAAATWNRARFHDDSWWGLRGLQDLFGATIASVDVPITTLPSGVQAAVDMRTADILARIPVLQAEVRGLPAGPSVDRTNKEFELRALVTELGKRKIDVALNCNSISDTGGAASPPEDEVWLAVNGGGSATLALTSQRTFRRGSAHTYQFAVSDFLPLSGPVRIEVNEHDRAGSSSPARDDVLIAFDWAPPFARTVQADRGGHYTAVVDFDK